MSGRTQRPTVGSVDASRALADATAVLVLDRPVRASERPQDGDALVGVGRREPLVTVGFTRYDGELASARASESGAERAVYLVDAAPTGGEVISDAEVTVESVGSPTDFTGIGVAIEECCARVDPADGVVCWVPSLTALLQYVDPQRGYRLCNAVVNRLAGSGGRVQFHLRADAHDDRTVATFASLADAVVDPSDDGVDVRWR
jgi:hypothetical protein